MDDYNHAVVIDERVFVQFSSSWMGIGPVTMVSDTLELPDSLVEQEIKTMELNDLQAGWLLSGIFSEGDAGTFKSRVAGFAGMALKHIYFDTAGTHYQGERENILQQGLEADAELIHKETKHSLQQSKIIALLILGYSQREIATWLTVEPEKIDSQRTKICESLVQSNKEGDVLGNILSCGQD